MKQNYIFNIILLFLVPFTAFSQTVNSVSDTSYNADWSVAYFVNTTILSEAGKNTITFTITPGDSPLGDIFDLQLYRDVDARFKDRVRIGKQIPLPANGIFVFEDTAAEWLDDGGGDYGYTPNGVLPANTPFFYSLVISRLPALGDTARPRRSYAAIHLPDAPETVISDPLNSDMTLISQVFPNSDDTTVIIKLDFAPDYGYYQDVLYAASAADFPGQPLYPAGDKLVFYGKVYLNNMADPNGRTDIGFGNLYWGTEGSAYARIKVAPEFLDSDNSSYLWLTSGRPGHSTVTPIPINFDFDDGSGGTGETVHTVSDTCYNADFSVAYYLNTTVVSVAGKNTVTFAFTPGTNAIGEVFDLNIYRDVDARFKDRERIAKAVPLPANGVFIFEDKHATWLNDGGGSYGYTGTGGLLPLNVPYFYSVVVSKLDAFGGTARSRRSCPAIHLFPATPKNVIVDELDSDMTLVTQVFPNPDDTTVILKMDFAPDYSYYQDVLYDASAADFPGQPLYPAGDKLVFFGKVYLNNISDPNGRTDIGYGNLYWGHEGSAYAKFKVDEEFIDNSGISYAWFTSGRPGTPSMIPVPIELFGTVSATEVTKPVAINVYPNPSSGIVNIEMSDKVDLITVYNMNGQIVSAQKLDNTSTNTAQIDLSNENTGMYFIQVTYNNYIVTKKIVLE